MKTNETKMFTAQVPQSSIEQCIDGLPGWSHVGEASERQTFSYPFKVHQVRIFFRAAHRREALKQLSRVPFCDFRDVVEWSPEPASVLIRRKVEKAREICMAETFVGNFSRAPFFQNFYSAHA